MIDASLPARGRPGRDPPRGRATPGVTLHPPGMDNRSARMGNVLVPAPRRCCLLRPALACGAHPVLPAHRHAHHATHASPPRPAAHPDMECVLVSTAPTPGDPPNPRHALPARPPPDDWTLGPAGRRGHLPRIHRLPGRRHARRWTSTWRAWPQEYPDRRAARLPPFPAAQQRQSHAGRRRRRGRRAAGPFLGDERSCWSNQQSAWADPGPGRVSRPGCSNRPRALGLDAARFSAATGRPGRAANTGLQARSSSACRRAIPIMPCLLINGSIYQGPRDLRTLENLVSLLLLEKHQFTDCPPFVIDPQKQYFARLTHRSRATSSCSCSRRKPPWRSTISSSWPARAGTMGSPSTASSRATSPRPATRAGPALAPPATPSRTTSTTCASTSPACWPWPTPAPTATAASSSSPTAPSPS